MPALLVYLKKTALASLPWRFISLLLTAGALVTASGCATPRSDIVLLPSADGRPSAVVIYGKEGDIVLDRPYHGISSQGRSTESIDYTPEQLNQTFGSVLAAQPQRPERFEVYFDSETELSEASRRVTIPQLIERVKLRAAPEVRIVGHTDTIGNDEHNDKLSFDRALFVARLLHEAGLTVKPEVVGQGKRFPKIVTADNVYEPTNRRVEIIIR